MDAMMRARALAAGRAQPATSHRHMVVQRDALILAPLLMNGEDISIHIAAVGRRGDAPRLLWVPDPRDRRARDGLLAHLAEIVDAYFLERAREGPCATPGRTPVSVALANYSASRPSVITWRGSRRSRLRRTRWRATMSRAKIRRRAPTWP